jgi:flagella basal body P-ring formation protein FlgA
MRSHLSVCVLLVAVWAPVAHAASDSYIEPMLEDAVQAAVTIDEARARVKVVSLRLPHGCKAEGAKIERPVSASGSLTVKLQGSTRHGELCEGWVRATVSLTAPVMVTTRVVRTGESLDSATTVQWQEIRAGAQPAAPMAGGIAARTMMSGQVVDASSVRSNKPSAGSQVRVSIRMGALSVEQIGRLVECGNTHFCAVLPSGKRVEGALEDDRLVVMVP